MPAGGKPTVRSKRLGAALKKYRLTAKLDQEAAAVAVKGSVAKISRMESGHVSSRPLEVATLLRLYGVDDPDEYTRLEKLAKESGVRGWWVDKAAVKPGYADVISLENDATYIRTYNPVLIPGLLQADGYARAIISSGPNELLPEQVEELVAVRRQRQLRIGKDGVRLTAIIWEPAITARLGGDSIHTAQLQHLLNVAAEYKTVTIQILPTPSAVIAGTSSHFTAYSFEEDPRFEAVTIEGLRSSQVIEGTEDLIAYVNLFDALRSAARTPEQSLKFIRDCIGSKEYKS